MKAPAFWGPGRAGDWRARLLSPLRALYARSTARRLARPSAKVDGLSTICVGNLIAGGSGKTPTAQALATLLDRSSRSVGFLTRGYRGREAGPLRVDLDRHDAAAVGDEALLLARNRPTWVARDRLAGARMARAAGIDVLILDDGLQNPALDYDLRLCVVDGGFGFGNGRAIPAGPLREPVEVGLTRCDSIILIGDDATGVRARRAPFVIEAALTPSPPAGAGPFLAFAGLGRPEKVFESWRAAGMTVIETLSFPDHHAYRATDVRRLRSRAKALNAQLVTTEKDAVKLPADASDVATIPVALHWRDNAAVSRLLDEKILHRKN